MELALQIGLVQSLLDVLEGGISPGLEHAASVRAMLVDSIKCAADHPIHGPRVRAQLAQAPAWASYRDQRHDLFMQKQSAAMALAPGPSTTSGLISAPVQSPVAPESPPPLDPDSPPPLPHPLYDPTDPD